MPLLLFLLFIAVPLVEILVIIQVGQALGAWWTIALLVVDSLVGAWLLRVEGRRAWSQFRAALAEGRWPGDEVARGALVIVGGTLLLTPGFVTDIVGLLLLLSPTRRMVADVGRRRFARRAAGRRSTGQGDAARRDRGPGDLGIEVVEVEREPLPPEVADEERRED